MKRLNHDCVSIFTPSAISLRVSECADDLQLLSDRTGPSVRDDDGQRILFLRAHMDEMNVYSIDRGDEVRQSFELRFALVPVVVCRPVTCEFLHRRYLHTL